MTRDHYIIHYWLINTLFASDLLQLRGAGVLYAHGQIGAFIYTSFIDRTTAVGLDKMHKQ